MKKIILSASVATLFIACQKEKEYDAAGIFEATIVTVSAETSGKILSFDIAEGDSVEAMENIAVIDTTLLVLQRRQLGYQRKSTESGSPDIKVQAASLRAEITHQKQECDRQERLLADGATTQKQYDDARAMLNTLNARLTALLSSLDNSKKSLSDNGDAILFQEKQIDEQIDRCHINSPLTGTVLVKYAEPGEFATPGKPLVKIADLNKIYLRAYFTSSQLAGLKLGQNVTVIADFGGEEQFEYPGKITWIAEESEFTPKSIQTQDSRANLVYAVKVAVTNDGRLKLGQYGKVRL